MTTTPAPADTVERPIILPRWALTYLYSLFLVLSIAASIAGVPTLDLTTPHGYVTPWATLIGIAAITAIYGSTAERRESFERWGAGGLTALLSVYVVGAFVLAFESSLHASGRTAFGVVLLIASTMPTIRTVYLLRRVGMPRAVRKRG